MKALPAHFAVVALLCCCFAALAAGQSQCQNTINGLKYDLSPLSAYQQVSVPLSRSLKKVPPPPSELILFFFLFLFLFIFSPTGRARHGPRSW